MDIWASVSKQDLERGIGLLAKLSAFTNNPTTKWIIITFAGVNQCKKQDVIPVNLGIKREMKKELMNIIDRYNRLCDTLNDRLYEMTPTPDRLEPINANEKLFLASLCKK